MDYIANRANGVRRVRESNSETWVGEARKAGASWSSASWASASSGEG